VFIYKNTDLLYYRHFGKAIREERFSNLVADLIEDAFSRRNPSEVQSYDYFKYKITYTVDFNKHLMFLFVTGLIDNIESIQKEVVKFKEEFLNLFGEILDQEFDAKNFEMFDPTVDSLHRALRPKISLVGFSGVGKTTTTRLIKAEEIPMKHVPTITGDIATIKIGKLHFHLWDFAGQEQFSYLWNNFIKGSDAVLLITDSSLENVEKSKFFLELIKEEAPEAHTAVIGNKQDLPNALKSDQIEKILRIKTYAMVAVDQNNRTKMIQIIADILEMNTEISPLLRPLLQRDELTQEAMSALENGEFSKALLLFQKISDLCIELGDDSLGREFYDKAEQIKAIMKGEPEKEVPETTPPPQEPEKEVPETTPPPQEPEKEVPETTPPPQEPEKEVTETTLQPQEPEKEVPEPVEVMKSSDLFGVIEEFEKKEGVQPSRKEEKQFKKDLKKAKKKEKKKTKKKKKKRQLEEEVSEITSIIQKPSFLQEKEAPEVSSVSLPSAPEPAQTKKEPDTSWMPENIKALKEKRPPKIIPTEKKEEKPKEEVVVKPKIFQSKTGVKINAEDFIIKQKPKQVMSVPDGAKTKLTTSAYGQVVNPADAKLKEGKEAPPKPKPTLTAPVAPTKLMKPTIPKSTTISQPTEIKESLEAIEKKEEEKGKPLPIEEVEIPEGVNKKELEKLIIELKVKKTKLQEMSLDYDMKEFSGEITTEELNEKKLKLILMEKKLDKQIHKALAMMVDLG